MAFRGEHDRTLVLDFSAIRAAGAPIRGMQGRPASGPVSLLRAFLNIRRHVIAAARATPATERWEQALRLDHYLSMEVQVGGARRAARMATKSWRDPGVLRFIRAKEAGGLWTANNSVMVDAEFWRACHAAAIPPIPWPAMPWRRSRRRPAARGSTANPASSMAIGWRTTGPA